MSYYRGTLLLLLILVAGSVAGFLVSTLWRQRMEEACRAAEEKVATVASLRASAEREQRLVADRVKPLQDFTTQWEPYLRPAPSRDLGNHLRNALATLATRTGLTSEGATVPAEPRTYAVGGTTIKVQQVSLNVVGDSLPAVLAWLGAAESQFPYARVESLTLSAYASRSVQLAVTFFHPVDEGPVGVAALHVSSTGGRSR